MMCSLNPTPPMGPRSPPPLQSKVEELYQRDVARMNPGEAGKMDQEYKSFLAELGGGPPPEPDQPARGREQALGGAVVGGGGVLGGLGLGLPPEPERPVEVWAGVGVYCAAGRVLCAYAGVCAMARCWSHQ